MVLFADRAHDAGGRAAVARRALCLLQDRLIVRGNRRHRKLRLHEYNLVAAGLEIVEQVSRSLGGRMLEIMQQHNAFLYYRRFEEPSAPLQKRICASQENSLDPDCLDLCNLVVFGLCVPRTPSLLIT